MQLLAKIAQSKYISIRNITEPLNKLLIASYISYQDGRVVKALDLSSNGRVVRVGSNPTPGN